MFSIYSVHLFLLNSLSHAHFPFYPSFPPHFPSPLFISISIPPPTLSLFCTSRRLILSSGHVNGSFATTGKKQQQIIIHVSGKAVAWKSNQIAWSLSASVTQHVSSSSSKSMMMFIVCPNNSRWQLSLRGRRTKGSCLLSGNDSRWLTLYKSRMGLNHWILKKRLNEINMRTTIVLKCRLYQIIWWSVLRRTHCHHVLAVEL